MTAHDVLFQNGVVIVPSKQKEITQAPSTVALLLTRTFKLVVVRVLRYVMSKSASMDPDRIAHHLLGDLPDNNFLSTDYKHIKIDVMPLCHSQQFYAGVETTVDRVMWKLLFLSVVLVTVLARTKTMMHPHNQAANWEVEKQGGFCFNVCLLLY